VNTPSAKAKGFSRLRGLLPVVTPNCVTRASRDWIPRLSIPRAKHSMTVCLEELVSDCSVNSANDSNTMTHFIPVPRTGLHASEDNECQIGARPAFEAADDLPSCYFSQKIVLITGHLFLQFPLLLFLKISVFTRMCFILMRIRKVERSFFMRIISLFTRW